MSNATAPEGTCQNGDKRSRTATRRRLLSAATDVFAVKGIDGASIGELCAAAGFTRGAFYSNFTTKLDVALAVFDHLVDQIIAQLDAQLDHWLDSGLATDVVVTRIIEGVTGHTSNANQQAVRVELFLAAFRSPEVREALVPLRERLFDAIERALTRVAESQHLEFVVPAQDVAQIMLTSYSGQLTDRMAVGDSTRGAHHIIPTMWLAFTRPADGDVNGGSAVPPRG